MEELDLEDYTVVETDDSYERYLNGRAIENSTSIRLEEDTTYDELYLQREQEKQKEEEKDYEI